MELKDFITATLTGIQAGVQGAIDKSIATQTPGAINPCWGQPTTSANRSLVEKVHFDIAVTVSDRTTGNAEAGIKVVGVRLGGGGSGSTETSNVSRIQFSISIIPPVTTIT